MRPKRKSISSESLNLIGIPKKFHNAKLSDVSEKTKSRKDLKDFVSKYIQDLENWQLEKGIFFFGSNGVGKTYLSSIILKHAYICRYTCYRITLANYSDVYTRVWSGRSLDEKSELEEKLYQYKGCEILVLEEIGKNIDSTISTPILEDLLRYREDKNLITIICTNMKLDGVKELYGESVCSLIKGATVPIKIVGEDFRG